MTLTYCRPKIGTPLDPSGPYILIHVFGGQVLRESRYIQGYKRGGSHDPVAIDHPSNMAHLPSWLNRARFQINWRFVLKHPSSGGEVFERSRHHGFCPMSFQAKHPSLCIIVSKTGYSMHTKMTHRYSIPFLHSQQSQASHDNRDSPRKHPTKRTRNCSPQDPLSHTISDNTSLKGPGGETKQEPQDRAYGCGRLESRFSWGVTS